MIKFIDRANIGDVKTTAEGFLIAHARALRAGVQVYRASELGLMGDGLVRVYRPESSIRDAGSLQSLSHAPVTIDHPSEMVTADNWKELAVGEVSTAAQWDGNFIALPLILKDKAAIEAVEAGKVELSAGYVADMAPADSPNYDYVMGPPRYNHIAIVDRARAGSQARIGDNATTWGAAPQPETERKSVVDMIKVMVGDKAVTVAASDADIIAAMAKDHQKAIDEKDEMIGQLKAECAEANSKILSDAQIEALVKEKAEAMARREAVRAALGDEAASESDTQILGIYKYLTKTAKADPVRQALADAKPKGGNPWDEVLDKMYGKKEPRK